MPIRKAREKRRNIIRFLQTPSYQDQLTLDSVYLPRLPPSATVHLIERYTNSISSPDWIWRLEPESEAGWKQPAHCLVKSSRRSVRQPARLLRRVRNLQFESFQQFVADERGHRAWRTLVLFITEDERLVHSLAGRQSALRVAVWREFPIRARARNSLRVLLVYRISDFFGLALDGHACRKRHLISSVVAFSIVLGNRRRGLAPIRDSTIGCNQIAAKRR